MNNHRAAIASVIAIMVVITAMMIGSYCHNGESCKIGRIIPVIVRRVIWNIGRRINVLDYRC